MELQVKKPRGWFGRWILRNMNKRHSNVTDWGLSHVAIPSGGAILDLGCGGGRTIAKLAAASDAATVHGLDHSAESLRVASEVNAKLVGTGRVLIRQGSVSQLPYQSDAFDLVTAVETHFFWPDLPQDVREVCRVLKPGGRILVIAEIYKGAPSATARLAEKFAPKSGMKLLTPDEHRELLATAGFTEVEVFTEPAKAWICVTGRKP